MVSDNRIRFSFFTSVNEMLNSSNMKGAFFLWSISKQTKRLQAVDEAVSRLKHLDVVGLQQKGKSDLG